jgi:uncharacterized membrane protein
MANPSSQRPTVEPFADQPKTYRVNTGSVAFVPFTANSVEDAIEYVRQNQNPHYAAARWLQVLQGGAYVWVT